MIWRMSHRTSMLRIAAGGIVVLFLGVAGWIVIKSGDGAAPDVSDLVPQVISVSDEANAAVYFEKMMASLQWRGDRSNLEFKLEEWEDTLVVDLISRNVEALTLLERGLACPACQPSGTSEVTSSEQEPWYRMFMLVAQKAAYERRTGQRDIACETSGSLLRLGACLTAHSRGLLEWTAGLRALELGLKSSERLLQESRFDEAELVRWSDRLRQIDILDRGLAEAVKAEFQQINEAIDECSLRVPRRALFSGREFQPNRTRETAAQFYRSIILNVSRAYAQVRLPAVPPLRLDRIHRLLLSLGPNRQGKILRELFFPERDVLETCFMRKCEIQSLLAGLRLVVACRLYEIRRGRLPETLAALVPELLAEVPRDPFDGKPFRYLRADAVVYSVGKDLKDPWKPGGETAGASQPDNTATDPEAFDDWPESPSRPPLFHPTQEQTDDLAYHLIIPSEVAGSTRE